MLRYIVSFGDYHLYCAAIDNMQCFGVFLYFVLKLKKSVSHCRVELICQILVFGLY
jgi:hypothetical protein